MNMTTTKISEFKWSKNVELNVKQNNKKGNLFFKLINLLLKSFCFPRTHCKCWSTPSSTLDPAKTRPVSVAPELSVVRPSTSRPWDASTRWNIYLAARVHSGNWHVLLLFVIDPSRQSDDIRQYHQDLWQDHEVKLSNQLNAHLRYSCCLLNCFHSPMR